MRLLGLHHVQVNVPDVPAALEFYALLGMTRRTDRPDIGVDGAWLDAGGQQIHLVESTAPADLGQHFALEVREPRALGDGLPRQTSLHDPAGNRIELREPPAGGGA